MEHGLKECTYSLHFPAGRHVDTGAYVFISKNKYGYAESNAFLNILLKPEIVGFKDQTSLPFHQVIYEVSVHANPKPKVTWTKNGENLCNNDNCEVIADIEKEIYRLVILSVNPKDEGPYTITATNNQGETVAQAQLLLHGKLILG